MKSVNGYIEDFLDYYCKLHHPPEYAVLLKGPWGSGKSWFINNYCKKLKDNGRKHIYVSLYGIGSFSEIESIFFQQLHPVLSSKGMAITSKILKGALKATLKIDLDGDKRDDLSVNTQIPDISLPSYLSNTDGYLLVFDDLERCCLKTNEVLGYINHFVELQGYKAIIIANENEITEREERSNPVFELSYAKIKEKLIGKTFQISPDVEAALDDFFNKISDEKAKSFMSQNRGLIVQLYKTANYENLRHLKHALWDYERIFTKLPEKATDNEELLKHLLTLLFIFSFEIKSGAISAQEIRMVKVKYYSRLFKEKGDSVEVTPAENLINKYSNTIDLHDLLLDDNTWENILDKGIIDTATISESLHKTKYLLEENTPEWVRLWHFMDLTDEEFDKYLADVENNYYQKSYDEIGVIQHVTGILLWLSSKGLYQKTISEIVPFAKEYIDYLRTSGRIGISFKHFRISFLERESWGGLGYFGKDMAEFKEIYDYFLEARNKAEIDNMPHAANDLIVTMKDDPDKFYRMITLSNSEDQVFYDTPIFSHIGIDAFVEAFLSLQTKDKNTVMYALERRYEFDNINQRLLDELEPLERIKNALESKQKAMGKKLSSYILKSLIENHIDKIILRLMSVKLGQNVN